MRRDARCNAQREKLNFGIYTLRAEHAPRKTCSKRGRKQGCHNKAAREARRAGLTPFTFAMEGTMPATFLCPLRNGAMSRLDRPHSLPSSKKRDGYAPTFFDIHGNCDLSVGAGVAMARGRSPFERVAVGGQIRRDGGGRQDSRQAGKQASRHAKKTEGSRGKEVRSQRPEGIYVCVRACNAGGSPSLCPK